MSDPSLPALSAAAFPFSVRDISCRRGERRVFAHVSLEIEAGGAWLVRGANGAGKTSLLRLLAGLNRPESGSCDWSDGETIRSAPERSLYIGHLDALKPTLSVTENLAFWSRFLGLPNDFTTYDPLTISPLQHRPVRLLSAGQKRRVSLSRLLLSPAAVWLLDEPTTALDAKAQDALWQLVAAHRARGGAVVLSTHGPCDLPDAQTLDLGGAA